MTDDPVILSPTEWEEERYSISATDEVSYLPYHLAG